jgi:hypothetical protein
LKINLNIIEARCSLPSPVKYPELAWRRDLLQEAAAEDIEEEPVVEEASEESNAW